MIIILILSIFNNSNSDKINVAFYNYCIRYGGIERVTAILLNYFYKEDNFNFYLITVSGILEGEYSIIHCTHSVFLYRIYQHFYHIENTVYQTYKNCKYVLALVPLENDYLFKIWE